MNRVCFSVSIQNSTLTNAAKADQKIERRVEEERIVLLFVTDLSMMDNCLHKRDQSDLLCHT